MKKPESHVSKIEPRPKMDTPVGLFAGACSCGWKSAGLESERGAEASARQHCRDKNGEGLITMAVIADRITRMRKDHGLSLVVIMAANQQDVQAVIVTPWTRKEFTRVMGVACRHVSEVAIGVLWPFFDEIPGLLDDPQEETPFVRKIRGYTQGMDPQDASDALAEMVTVRRRARLLDDPLADPDAPFP